MSTKGINQLLGLAVISDTFRAGLLNGQRAQLVSNPDIDLDLEEAAALMAIEAENLRDFAAQVEQLIDQGLGQQITAAPQPQPAPIRWPSWPRVAASNSSIVRPH